MTGPNTKKASTGFSLIEVLIVVAIIGILAAVAVPSYAKYMEKTRRADAVTFLSDAAAEQYRFFSENNRYATKMSELGMSNGDTAQSDEGHYVITVVSPNDTSYTLTATPVAGSPQAKDTECGAFSVTSSNQKSVSGSSSAANCW